MPHKDADKNREYQREYQKKYHATPEYKAKRRAYFLKNKQHSIETSKTYYVKNKKRLSLYYKEYNIKNHQKYCIRQWKRQGIVDEDYDSLYQCYIEEKNCWICGHDFSKYRKNLDHDHETGEARFVCCNLCNTKLL